MNQSDVAEQKRHFDTAQNQYPQDSIMNPPLHTVLEQNQVIRRLEHVRKGEQILDFGAGTGRLSVALARAGYSVLSFDISTISLDHLRDVARDLGLSSIEMTHEYPNNRTFPAVVGADILHHVDLDEYLPKLYASLADGGRAVFSEPGGMNLVWYPYLSIFYDMRVEKRIVYSNLYTLPAKFKKYGFRDVQITGLGLLPRPVFNWSQTACLMNDASGNLPLVRWLAYRYIISARK